MKHRDILLYSGGLDSFIGYWYIKRELKRTPSLLYVDLGHKYNKQEKQAIERTLEYMNPPQFIEFKNLNLADFEAEDAHIPNRNAFLSLIASLYAYDKIWLVVQKGEMTIRDRDLDFFIKMSDLLSHVTGEQITVDTPFVEKTKTEMVKWYVESGLDIDALKQTHSCYHPIDGKPCGNCGACFRRWTAMSLNGIEEEYAVNPWETKLAEEYEQKAWRGTYGERDFEIIEAMERMRKREQ